MSSLPTAVNVSPLIRFGRWGLLSLGIAYGAFHQSRLSKKEAKFREEEAKLKIIRDAKLAEEKKKNLLAEQKALDELSGKSF